MNEIVANEVMVEAHEAMAAPVQEPTHPSEVPAGEEVSKVFIDSPDASSASEPTIQ